MERDEDQALLRYSRHLILERIGEEGQRRLLSSRVVVFGCGGLGSAALLYLAASGVGHIRIVDPDRVSLDNLQRQVLFSSADLGRTKTDSARDTLELLNSDVSIETKMVRVDRDMAGSLIESYSLVLDCSDNFAARDAVNFACVALGTRLLSGSASSFSGSLAGFGLERSGAACYRCLYPEEPNFAFMSRCDTVGVFSPLVGVIGCLQAAEALKFLLGEGDCLVGGLVWYEAISTEFTRMRFRARGDCPICSKK